LGRFYLDLLSGWLGLGGGDRLDVSTWRIALNVVIYLSLPLIAWFFTRRIGEKRLGCERCEAKVLPGTGPWTMYGLLFTIVILLTLQRGRRSPPSYWRRPHRPAAARLLCPPVVRHFALGNSPGLIYDRLPRQAA
jgi:ACR3 family arsenite transporter